MVYIVVPILAAVSAFIVLWVTSRGKKQKEKTSKGVTLLNLSPSNDKWNKMALGIRDEDVPSSRRPKSG